MMDIRKYKKNNKNFITNQIKQRNIVGWNGTYFSRDVKYAINRRKLYYENNDYYEK